MAKSRMIRTKRKSGRPNGLILLIVLGMLALFTLLAVTYAVASGASRSAANALKIRAINENITVKGASQKVMSGLLRGTNDQKSPFYKNSILEDVYGPNAIKTQFGHLRPNAEVFSANWCKRFFITQAQGAVPKTNINLVKVSVRPDATINGPLSPFENEYNGRVLTVLDGPLKGQSFRILKYIGFVPHPTSTGRDGNFDNPLPNDASFQLPWSNPNYNDVDGDEVDYSVVIDLGDVRGKSLVGQVMNGNGKVETLSMPIDEWITKFNGDVTNLFFFRDTSATAPNDYLGYTLMINDAPFNNAGVGIEDVANVPQAMGPVLQTDGFGNIDASRYMNLPTSLSKKVPPGLLPIWDYLQDPNIMATVNGVTGVTGISTEVRQNLQQSLLQGGTNEGWDAPDYHDMFLAHQTFVGGGVGSQFVVTPSFHRPELVNYIAGLFSDPTMMSIQDVAELLTLIDASTARILSYGNKNVGFRANDPATNRFTNFTWSTPPTPTEINLLRGYVLTQINGPWDVDNDGDGTPDSIWMDVGLPVQYAPDGRMLKPLVAILIEDLDGRINLMAAGDRSQGLNGIDIARNVGSTNIEFKRANGQLMSQGFGYGPADISLRGLFLNTVNQLQTSSNRLSFFDEIFGARHSTRRPIDVTDTGLDRSPGTRGGLAFSGAFTQPNDPLSQLYEREIHEHFRHQRLPGMPLGRPGTVAVDVDRNGNLAFISPLLNDGNPTGGGVAARASEIDDDRYESAPLGFPVSDDPMGLAELESILRRFDSNVSSLPPRLRERLLGNAGYNNGDWINREITVRSSELRYPNLVSAMKQHSQAFNEPIIAGPASSYQQYIRMLHNQRHRRRTFPPATTDEPELSMSAVNELFPMEFSKLLKLDLNRPFGDGMDDDNDGQVDEPQELVLSSGSNELEVYPISSWLPIYVPTPSIISPSVASNAIVALGAYSRDIKLFIDRRASVNDAANSLASASRSRLASRQILARNLYCLAQLIVPRTYQFPGSASAATNFDAAKIRARALAQWAVNVVDFRDADAAHTRFEYDILPFGAGTNIAGPATARPGYWAPDHANVAVNGVQNKIYIGVVWGMELPDLLLTETLALHDKRLRDTDMESATGKTVNDGSMPDDDMDQYRFPLASTFLEVYATRTTDYRVNGAGSMDVNLPGVPSSLYRVAGSQVGLDLGRMCPTGTFGVQPVWRIAISEMFDPNDSEHPGAMLKNNPTALQTKSHQFSTTANRDGAANVNVSASIDQYLGTGLVYDYAAPTAAMPKQFERFVYFTTDAGGNLVTNGSTVPDLATTMAGQESHCVYTNKSSTTFLPGGSYLVIGPRADTSIGSATHNRFTDALWTSQILRSAIGAAPPILCPSYQRINLTINGVGTYQLNDVLANSPWMSRIKPAVGMVCTAKEPSGWATAFPGGVGINVSMDNPIPGRGIWKAGNVPTEVVNPNDNQGSRADNTPGFNDLPPDSWVDFTAATGNIPDQPFDYPNPSTNAPGDNAVLHSGQRYLTGTHEYVRVAYLQRVADPEVAYDPVDNPYLTIDWMPIDLTVFNGEAPLSQDPREGATPSVALQSRYKSGGVIRQTNTAPPLQPAPPALPLDRNNGFSYYSPITADMRVTPNQPVPPQIKHEAYFQRQLGFDKAGNWSGNMGNSATTLGYANAGYRDVLAANDPADPIPSTAELASDDWRYYDGFGPPIESLELATGLSEYRGAPARITSIAWFNRPYASPHEIMLVPFTGPGEFGYYHNVFGGTGDNQRRPFNFLPSFQTSNPFFVDTRPPVHTDSYWARANETAGSVEADWALLFDFLEVPPAFVDTNKFYHPEHMLTLMNDPIARRTLNSFLPPQYSTGSSTTEQGTVKGPSYLAPFNMLPTYMAPGKINLNTVSFDANGVSRALKALENNYLGAQRSNPLLNPIATAFATARRGYAGGSSSPFFGAVVAPHLDHHFPTQFAGAFRPQMSANLDVYVSDPTAREKTRSKFPNEKSITRSSNNSSESQAILSNNSVGLLFAAQGGTGDANDVLNQNDFVRLQRAMRLSNLVTYQSNVFAVRMTISLHEYNPISGFGNEYLDDSGEPKRERSFSIIDRSIPVGFRPGENLNTERTVLLQRILD